MRTYYKPSASQRSGPFRGRVSTLREIVVDTVREAVVLLDGDLRAILAVRPSTGPSTLRLTRPRGS
jgi:hypothetical protein